MLIYKELGSNLLLINRKFGGNVLLIDRKLAKLKDNAEYTSFPKLSELVKKLSNLNKIGKEKVNRLIFYSLAHFVEPVRQLCFWFVEDLTGLTDGLAMGRAELKGKKVAVGFFG